MFTLNLVSGSLQRRGTGSESDTELRMILPHKGLEIKVFHWIATHFTTYTVPHTHPPPSTILPILAHQTSKKTL